MPFNMFPFSNLHNLNADWLLRTVKQAAEDAAEAAQSAESIAAGVEGQLAKTVKVTPQTWTAAQKTQARTNIGAAAVADIPDVSDVLRYTAQDLTSAQKAQARENIGAVAGTGLALANAGAVVYNAEQELTTAQKSRVRDNIGAAPVDSYVKYASQSLTDAEKAQARTNIGAVGQADIPTIQGVVRFDQSQSLTGSQKLQARANIGAASSGDLQTLEITVDELALTDVYIIQINETAPDTFAITQGNLEDAQVAMNHNAPVIINLETISDGFIRGLASFTDAPLGDIFATLFNTYTPGINSSYGYRISISNNGSADVLAITKFTFKMLPDCNILDSGKTLYVGSTGVPEWAQPNPTVTVSGSTPTITPADNTIYKCGELTSLTISNPPATGAYSIVFTSGSTATTTTIPATILGLESFAAEANTLYEINVLDNRAVVGSWAVSA